MTEGSFEVEPQQLTALPERYRSRLERQPGGWWFITAPGVPEAVALERRPYYCDRGHYVAKLVDEPLMVDLNVDAADHWPRYYMDFSRAVMEVVDFLDLRLERKRVGQPEFDMVRFLNGE